MLQRIQTIYLLLAALTALLILFLPLGILPDSLESGETAMYLARNHIELLTIGLVMVSLPVGAIFLYAKRHAQLRMTIAGVFAVLVFAGIVLLSLASELGQVSWTVGSFLPLAYALALALAIRGIRHDERLVKSMDRFR